MSTVTGEEIITFTHPATLVLATAQDGTDIVPTTSNVGH
jgi:hypothetical protein